MSKGTGKINDAPQGDFSMWEPSPPAGNTACPGCETGDVVWVGSSRDYSFMCSLRCGWTCPREGEVKSKLKKPKLLTKKVTKKVKFTPDPPELVEAIRAECARRTKAMRKARGKFPSTNTVKGKGKKKQTVPNPNFTNKMQTRMHAFGFTAEDVRKELVK